MTLKDFLITGRTFDEYVAFFGLDVGALAGKKILDCPAGVSGFVAEAVQHGIDAHGCDMLYGFSREAIVRQAHASIGRIYEDVRWMAGHNWQFYGSVAQHRREREDALQRFSEDFPSPRYRREVLPELTYPDDSFDLLLSSHLLFVYDDRLNLDFHLASIASMLRVAQEVRLFPLVDFKNSRRDEPDNHSPLVEAVRQRFDAEIIPVGFEFQPGANACMRLLRTAT